MGASVLVDSSFYIRRVREGVDPLTELRVIGAARELAVCGVIRCEVARGLKEPKVLRRFQATWEVMQYVPTDNRLWADVEALAWQLDRAGKNLPLPDLIIAACARRIQAVVLTFDAHFQDIPGLTAVTRIV
ncbi:MAG TPA: PIN domain-containing protein [Candidatus Limnocylindria bacterium]|jgi:predicted nucleic acid-binding protein|nr:PIN domain-containing protein [Candidatus Limnocylindria bacterium]